MVPMGLTAVPKNGQQDQAWPIRAITEEQCLFILYLKEQEDNESCNGFIDLNLKVIITNSIHNFAGILEHPQALEA